MELAFALTAASMKGLVNRKGMVMTLLGIDDSRL